MSDQKRKQAVKEQYAAIAKEEGSCCGPRSACCSDSEPLLPVTFNEAYGGADKDIVSTADLGLGCGTPVTTARLSRGMTVVDLGSGAGIDIFLAAQEVGPEGKGIGIDMTDEMIARAEANKRKLQIKNVEFRKGEIEDLPIESDSVDHVLSNCVINLVPDKRKAFAEIHRILKPGGTVILSTPNARGWGAKFFGRRWINWHTPYHMQFFSRHSIRLAAEQAGLAVEEIKTITNSEWLFYQWIHLAMYPKLGEPSCFWTPSIARTLLQRLILLSLGLMHRTKINHLITRFFDSIGLGDNYVIVLKKP